MNNQVVFNKFAVKSGDNWVADSDLLKRTAGYKVTAEDWNSIFLILASQADNNATATKELADAASSQSDTLTAHSESISSLTSKVQTLETENERAVWDIRVGNNILSASDNTMTFPVDVDTMQSPDNLPTVRAVKDYVEHFSMDTSGFVIDAEFSDTSEHALQNKKVKEAVDNLQAQITSNLTSIVENSKAVTNKFTEVDSAISSVSAKAMTNLDRAEERINQNISNLQSALNAEVTNRESAVTSLGNAVSGHSTAIDSLRSDVGSHTSEISSIQDQISFNSSENLEKLLAGMNLDSSVFRVNSGKYFRFGRVYAATLNVTVNVTEGKAYNIGNMGSRIGLLSSDTIVGDINLVGNCWVRALKTVTNKAIDVAIVFIR